MNLTKARDEEHLVTVITLTIGDGEMEKMLFTETERKAIAEGLASDKISTNLHALRVIAMKAEKMAKAMRRLARLPGRLH